uniref:Vomeronasal type-1 receptor n=1 Tax=Panagrolaimus sp. PS1159 TaxID=55785 RepID=A0AC35FL01_9BILA
MCYFGLVYINKCPAKKEIPVYLLIEGSVGLLQVTLLMMRHRRERQEDLGEDTDLTGIGLNSTPQNHYSTNSSKITELIIWAFLFVWFIIGNIWVFEVFLPPGRQHERSKTPTYWCHSYTYNIALIQILSTHFVIAFVIISSIFLAFCAKRFMGMRHPQLAR